MKIEQSKTLAGIEWLGKRIPYRDADVMGDSFPMTWAEDDHIYTSAGDPWWGIASTPEERLGVVSGLDVERFVGGPTDYTIEKRDCMTDFLGWGGGGPKPTGMICVDGVLYLAIQNVRGLRRPARGLCSQHGSDAHILANTCRFDKGQQWTPRFAEIKEPMFPGHLFGGPVFINFGKDNANARDAYIYAVSADQWDNGSNLRLGRVPAQEIMRTESWQWVYSFTPTGEPAWTYSLADSIPVLSIDTWISCPDMVYIAALRRYILLSWHLYKDFSPDHGTDLLIFEAPEPWGPFSLVHREEDWEGKDFNPYCPKLPLKWMSADGTSGWLQFSGKWGGTGILREHYRSHVRPFRFVLAGSPTEVRTP